MTFWILVIHCLSNMSNMVSPVWKNETCHLIQHWIMIQTGHTRYEGHTAKLAYHRILRLFGIGTLRLFVEQQMLLYVYLYDFHFRSQKKAAINHPWFMYHALSIDIFHFKSNAKPHHIFFIFDIFPFWKWCQKSDGIQLEVPGSNMQHSVVLCLKDRNVMDAREVKSLRDL
jgi:hypothetical protein